MGVPECLWLWSPACRAAANDQRPAGPAGRKCGISATGVAQTQGWPALYHHGTVAPRRGFQPRSIKFPGIPSRLTGGAKCDRRVVDGPARLAIASPKRHQLTFRWCVRPRVLLSSVTRCSPWRRFAGVGGSGWFCVWNRVLKERFFRPEGPDKKHQ